jgi:hypothetical protein
VCTRYICFKSILSRSRNSFNARFQPGTCNSASIAPHTIVRRSVLETCAENFPRDSPPGREQEVRGDPAGREMLSREYRGEGFNFEGNPAGKFMST